MKLSYILQMKELCIMCLFGFVLGIFYGIINIHTSIKRTIFLQIITDILFITISTLSFTYLLNIISLGEMRLFLILGTIIGFLIERITLGKLFAKNYKNMYNFIIKILKSLYNSKFGRIIFK